MDKDDTSSSEDKGSSVQVIHAPETGQSGQQSAFKNVAGGGDSLAAPSHFFGNPDHGRALIDTVPFVLSGEAILMGGGEGG